MRKFAAIFALVPLLIPVIAYGEDTAAAATPVAATTAAAAPAPASSAFAFQRQGIFDCNQSGSYAMSVGALSAIGGAYVPVADAAVELNTGTLVYKECVLREVVDKEREAALTAFLKQMQSYIQKGRGGNAQYVKNEVQEKVLVASDPTELQTLQDTALWQNVSADLQTPLKRATAQLYEGERSGLQATSLTCPYKGSLNSYWSGQSYNQSTFFIDFFNASQPQCDPVTEDFFVEDIANARIARALQTQQDQWNWGRGFYPIVDQNGNVLTPSSVVEQSFEQILQSPVQQLQSANDIGQMIGALYAGVTTQVVGDSGGLAGISQSTGGQPSYLDQVATESSQGLQGAANNAGLQILNAAQQIESSFYQAVNGSAQNLAQSQSQLQAAEAQCWVSIISKVCATPLKADNTCAAIAGACTTTTDADGNQVTSCPSGGTLHVATSTAFSSAVISSQITPLISPITQSLQSVTSALKLVANLIQGITNTASLDAQRVALEQLDSLVAQHQLHSETDLQNAVQQQQSIATTMSNLLQSTAQIWGGSGTDGSGNFPWDGTTNPGNGWCNVNNSGTQQAWIQTWSKK